MKFYYEKAFFLIQSLCVLSSTLQVKAFFPGCTNSHTSTNTMHPMHHMCTPPNSQPSDGSKSHLNICWAVSQGYLKQKKNENFTFGNCFTSKYNH